MRALNTNPNVDNSDLVNYPNGRVKNNTGTGTGTPVNERVYGDYHQTIAKLMRLYGIDPNNLPDNETNGFQIIDAIRALASKNDFIVPLSLNSGVLSVPIKLGFMLENESVICKAGFALGAETQIKGSDAPTFSFTSSGDFLINEYVRLIKTSSGVTLVRLADNVSLDAMVGALDYLKKASQLEEDAGVSDEVATTPLVNKETFTKRVIGVDSDDYLADPGVANGLLSAAYAQIIADLPDIRNQGTFSGYNTGMSPSGTVLPHNGNITNAVVKPAPTGNSIIECTMANAMDNTDYKVHIYVESQGNVQFDNDCGQFLFKVVSTTVFQISNYRVGSTSNTQNLKIHLKVEQN